MRYQLVFAWWGAEVFCPDSHDYGKGEEDIYLHGDTEPEIGASGGRRFFSYRGTDVLDIAAGLISLRDRLLVVPVGQGAVRCLSNPI